MSKKYFDKRQGLASSLVTIPYKKGCKFTTKSKSKARRRKLAKEILEY